MIEGWHGVAFGKPMPHKGIYRHHPQVLAREAPLTYHGEHYHIPYTGPGATGLGKPLRSIVHGDPGMKFYTASITPAGLRMAGEVSDGTLPIFFSPEQPTGGAADSRWPREGGQAARLERFRHGPVCEDQHGS